MGGNCFKHPVHLNEYQQYFSYTFISKNSAENHTVDIFYGLPQLLSPMYTNTERHINNLLVRIELKKLK